MVGVRLLADPASTTLLLRCRFVARSSFAQALVPEFREVDSSLLSIEIRLFFVVGVRLLAEPASSTTPVG